MDNFEKNLANKERQDLVMKCIWQGGKRRGKCQGLLEGGKLRDDP